jgi:hypothetical protein
MLAYLITLCKPLVSRTSAPLLLTWSLKAVWQYNANVSATPLLLAWSLKAVWQYNANVSASVVLKNKEQCGSGRRLLESALDNSAVIQNERNDNTPKLYQVIVHTERPIGRNYTALCWVDRNIELGTKICHPG